MKWIARLEARFGRYAVPNVTLVIILGQILAFIAAQVRQDDVLSRLWLIRERVLDGEIWRLVTFVFMPPATNVIFAFFAWYLFYLMGTALERHWGAFRYNIYLLIGVLAAIAVGMLIPGGLRLGIGGLGPTGYLGVSVFLAFAYLYPDFVIHFMLILPIRIKWLAMVTAALLGLSLLLGDWGDRAMVAAILVNFLVFFGGDLVTSLRNRRRRAAFESRIRSASGEGKPRHKCAVCGVTSKDDPKMQFRYCSQCAGHLCYCMDHLRDHEHVTSEDEAALRGER